MEKVSASVRVSACICILYSSGNKCLHLYVFFFFFSFLEVWHRDAISNADISRMVIACESLGMEHKETTRSVWFVACAAYGEQNVAPQAVAKG